MLWETSNLDPMEGIRFRGLTIPECQAVLPTYSGIPGDGEPLLESMIWLLLTSEVPTKEQVDTLTAELFSRSELPSHVVPLLNSLPKDMHPMTQFTIGLNACQTESKFAKAYAEGAPKDGLPPLRLGRYSQRLCQIARDCRHHLPQRLL